MAKEDNTNTEENITLDVMPGADPVPEEEQGQDFKVDMNFETQEEEDENESETEEEPQEGTEEAEEEEEAEAVAEEPESGGEESVLEEDEGDTQQPEESVETGVDEEAPKEPMIPKSRFDEVLQKQKALQKKLNEALAPKVEDVKEAPEFNFEEKEKEYQTLVLEGESEAATKLRSEIRAAERQQLMFEMQAKMGQTVTQNQEMVDLQTKATQLEAMYPELNQADPNFNQDKTNEVLELRDAFITQGYMGADALQKSVDLLMGKKPEATVDEVQQQVAEKKKVANTTKKIQAAESQPPAMKGKNKVDKKVDINSMSIDEFDALPAETLKRMRGDFG